MRELSGVACSGKSLGGFPQGGQPDRGRHGNKERLEQEHDPDHAAADDGERIGFLR